MISISYSRRKVNRRLAVSFCETYSCRVQGSFQSVEEQSSVQNIDTDDDLAREVWDAKYSSFAITCYMTTPIAAPAIK
jgi:NADH:ubiquinone oxidoreductase subunit E